MSDTALPKCQKLETKGWNTHLQTLSLLDPVLSHQANKLSKIRIISPLIEISPPYCNINTSLTQLYGTFGTFWRVNVKGTSPCSQVILIPCINRKILLYFCIKQEAHIDLLDFTFASPNICCMISIFYPLHLHFDSLNWFCFGCEIAIRTKLEKLSCLMCVAFCSIAPIWKLYIIPDRGTKSFFAWKINHSSSNIYGSLLYERHHTRN